MIRYLRSLLSSRAAAAAAESPLAAARDAAAGAAERSARWPAARKAHLAANPTCAACGSREKPEVHHLVPFHVRPDLELEPSNLLTLCEGDVVNCHFLFGHCRDWRAWNHYAVRDAKEALAALRRARASKGEVRMERF